MWSKNIDNKWYKKIDTLDKISYDSLKQDIEKVRLYSKCLSGSTFVPVNNLDNIYDILDNNRENYNWYISNEFGSSYSYIDYTPENPKSIDGSSIDEYYDKYVYEYGLTLKNKFTPNKLISDSINNFIEVDVATTDQINLVSYRPGIIIDGVILKNGHRILVKDQKSFITLSSSIDPNTYFTHSYYVSSTQSSTIEYYYFNSDNGIYVYNNNTLTRDDILSYSDAHKFSVSVKLGDINTKKQYHLSRLSNGYYPLYLDGDSIEFIEKENLILRNRVDYNNIYEISYNDIIKHGTQSFSYNNFQYQIPERVISIGEFGVILNNQYGVSNIIVNKYKDNLYSICETTKYYWVCGDNGSILKISKFDFNIVRVSIEEFGTLTSIDFVDDLRGICVGKLNLIFFTQDGGLTWNKISKVEFDEHSYNKVIYNKDNTAYICGNSGVFIQMDFVYNEWIFYKRKISKYLDINEPTEEYLLVDDINDMIYSTFSSWNISYSTQSIAMSDSLFLVTNNSNVLIYDTSNCIKEYDFIYLSLTSSTDDVKSVSISNDNLYFNSDSVYSININSFNSFDVSSNVLTSTYSIVMEYDKYVNKIFNYKDINLYLCGNYSTLYYTGYTSSIFDIDANFNDKYDSKLLFLDYEIGSKLNFFDDNQIYRLPTSLTFSYNDISSNLSITNIDDERNWLEYYKNTEKTFQYYSSFDDTNQVLISSTFSYSATTTYFSFTASDISFGIDGIISLAPTIDIATSSKFMAGTVSLTGSTFSQNVFIYKYLMIFRKLNSYPVNEGDVLHLESDIININLVVNKILTIASYKYLYCYTDFNNTIINDIKTYTGDINVVNLNKYTTIGSTSSSDILNLRKFDDMWIYDNKSYNYFAYSPINGSTNDLLLNFNLHPIGFGYTLNYSDDYYTLSAKYNNKTAYYNMQSKVYGGTFSYNMSYTESFLKFGYNPTYNLYDYLSNISNKFDYNKKFHAMPSYTLFVGNSNSDLTSDNVYIDTNYDTNKLIFGENLKFEWNSIWINTFVDVTLINGLDYGDSSATYFTTERLLVMNKYYDSDANGYVIEFHKKLSFDYGTAIDYIDIFSRRSLTQISSDLQLLNNIQRSELNKNIQYGNTYSLLENDINFNFTTDSYCKILLSDKDIKDNLTGVVYRDSINELSLNIIKLEEEISIDILSTDRYATGSTDYLLITCSQSHNLSVNDGIMITFNGLTYSSNQLNQSYFGYHVVKGILGTYSFYTHRIFDGIDIPYQDLGVIKFTKRDPFLNYTPVDIMQVGVDKQAKRAIEVKLDNIVLSKTKYSLVNIDFKKYRYELVDGLSIIDIYNKYPWILEGDISNAIIGEDNNGLVWYMGDWSCGRWFGGTWMSGRWVSGDWYNGIWNSYNIQYRYLNISKGLEDNSLSKWYNGRWFDGTWNNGTWFDGRRYSGTWNNGIWYNGIWNDGTWNGGEFNGGIWVYGTWNNGIFNCNNKPSYWINGIWYGGDFENGLWYNGEFLEKNNSLSRFGTKSFNTRTSIWKSGNFSGGEFHSYLNKDRDGDTVASEYNKYSIWNTGTFNGGDWYGGVAYAINFNSATWWGGIIEEIQIIGINVTQNSYTKLILNGKFNFNKGDSIWVVNDNNYTPYSTIGSNEHPGNYKVLICEEVDNKTVITINRDLYITSGNIDIDDIETGLRLTTIFKDSTWKSGIWTNGIFDGGYFEGGIWYGGLFSSNSNWGR